MNKLVKWDIKAKIVQKMVFAKAYKGRKVNSFEPVLASTDRNDEQGRRVINDLSYGDTYPNSFLDLMYPKVETGSLPVLLYFHGGGFLFGSKTSGDPLAAGNVAGSSFLEVIRDLGIVVANADYALAPEYRYPIQLEQVNDALKFLHDNAEIYGLDPHRIIIGGGSAGAILTEIFGLMLKDVSYAEKIGVKPTIDPEDVKGLIIDEAPLCIRDYHNEDMDTMLGCWLGENDLLHADVTALLDVPDHLTDYYPCFVSASNVQHFFPDAADKLVKVLEEKGIRYVYDYPDPSKGKYDHGYLSTDPADPVVQEGLNKVKTFLQTIL